MSGMPKKITAPVRQDLSIFPRPLTTLRLITCKTPGASTEQAQLHIICLCIARQVALWYSVPELYSGVGDWTQHTTEAGSQPTPICSRRPSTCSPTWEPNLLRRSRVYYWQPNRQI